jgi:hypothetical protein
MNIFWNGVFRAVARVLLPIIQMATPSLIEEIRTFLKGLYAKALETPNPWDDFLVGLMLDMFGIERID